jgi:peptidyl-prolyl cis-trans isomerase B (cyclophilin B)
MAARQDAARRRRLLQARIGAGVAGIVVIAAVVWIVVASTGGNSSQTAANATPTPSDCKWINSVASDPSASPGANPSLPAGVKDVGTPQTKVPRSGFQVLTFNTNQGVIKVEMNLSKTPCTAASMAYLAGKGFYNNSSCHRLVDGIYALQCGDPSGTGSGGATYSFANENLPTGKMPTYHLGDVAMANTGQPNSNGSQFFFLYDNSQLQADYSLWGHVIEGFDVIKKIATGGDDGAFAQQAGGGHPKIQLTCTSVTAGPVTPRSVAPATTPPPATTAPAATPTATPTATATPSP